MERCLSPDAGRAPAAARAPALAGLAGFLRRAVAIRRSRAALAALSPDQLRDIGVTPAQARRESARPFWDMQGWDQPFR